MNQPAKRSLSVLLVMCLVLALAMPMASAEGEKVTLRFMIWGSASIYQGIVDTINATYPEFAERVNVEIVVGGSGDPEVAEKIRLSLASGEPCADLIQLNYTQIPEFARAGALMDLSELTAPYADNLTDAAIAMSQYDGQTVAVANQVNSKLFYYRKDICDECGIDPTTWKTVDDLIAATKLLHEKYPDAYFHNINKETGSQDYDIYMMLANYGAKFIDENGDYIVDSDPGVRAAFETLKKIYDADIAFNSGDFTPDWENALATGQLVGELTGSWFKLFIPGYAPDQSGEWTACLWPEEIHKGSEAGGSVLVVPAFSTCPDEAKEFLKYYRLEDKGVEATFVNDSRTPITKSIFESEAMQGEHEYLSAGAPYWQTELVSYAEENFSIFNYTPQAMTEMSMVNGWATRFFRSEVSLDEMLSGLNGDLKNQIGNAFE